MYKNKNTYLYSFFFLVLFQSWFKVNDVSAHVAYVLGQTEFRTLLGTNLAFLLAPLKDVYTYLLCIVSLLVFLAIYELVVKSQVFNRWYPQFLRNVVTYDVYIPLMFRIALGFSLIGSSISGNLVSPAISGRPEFAFIQLLLGFLLLAGFFTFFSAFAAVILYIYAVTQYWYLIGNLDFFALALGILVLANPKPGVDDLVGIYYPKVFAKLRGYAPYIVRLSTGIAFIILAVYEKILNPHLSEAVVFRYNLTHVVAVSPALWVLGAGVVETTIGVALLFGKKVRLVSAVALAVLTLTFFYFREDVTAHITLFVALSALFLTEGKIPKEHM